MSESAVGMLLQMVVSLAVVLALAFILLRFVLPRMTGLTGSIGEEIEILSVRHLDRQNKVALLRSEGNRFLVAFSVNGVALLHTTPDEPAGKEGEG